MKIKTYRSRISPILWLVIWSIVLGCLFYTIGVAIQNPLLMGTILLIVIWVPTLTFLLIVMLGIKYMVNEKELIIKVSFYTERRISINKIWTIERSYATISSPASSLKRLKVVYSDREILVSPTKEKEFLGVLKVVNPKIKILNLDYNRMNVDAI